MYKKLVKVYRKDRYFFTGTFDHYMINGGSRGISQRVMITDIRDEYGNKIAEYTWFHDIKTFGKLQLVKGDRVSFYARIVYYQDEYPNARYGTHEVYPRFLNPTKARKLFNPAKSINETNNYCRIHINTR